MLGSFAPPTCCRIDRFCYWLSLAAKLAVLDRLEAV